MNHPLEMHFIASFAAASMPNIHKLLRENCGGCRGEEQGHRCKKPLIEQIKNVFYTLVRTVNTKDLSDVFVQRCSHYGIPTYQLREWCAIEHPLRQLNESEWRTSAACKQIVHLIKIDMESEEEPRESKDS